MTTGNRVLLVLLLGCLVSPGVPAGVGTARFRDVAAEAGLDFGHVNGAAGQFHLPEIMGSGGALLDYDGDGDLDILLVQGRNLEEDSRAARSRPRLFRNDLNAGSGGLRFTEVTADAGFLDGDVGMGVAVGDYDNDGDPDLYLTNLGRNRLYRNNGDGTFSDVTAESGTGLDDPRWSTSASFSDYDADGDLDLFVANYVAYSVADHKVCTDPAGSRDYCGPLQFRPARNRLFRNDAGAGFRDVTEQAGLLAADGASLGVSGADFSGDGRSDFYVANDASANQLWINQGDGTFQDEALLAGVAFNADGQPEGSMGIAAGDPDNDADLDLFVTNITSESHAFYENLGRSRFEDRRLPTLIGAATRPYTGFGTEWFDFDQDGFLDLFVANGAVTVLEALRGDRLPYRQRNQILRNLGDGRFQDVTVEAGEALQMEETSRGAAFGDVDNDGDVDILVTNNGGPVRLLLNDGAAGHWLQVRLEGVADNRQGLGARVGVVTSTNRILWRRAHTDGSYMSSSDPRVHVGLGSLEEIQGVIVEWPRGLRERWRDVEIDRIVTLDQGTGAPDP